MQFNRTSSTFPFSAAVIHSGRTLETVPTGIAPGTSTPISGGVEAEMREILRQLDENRGQARAANGDAHSCIVDMPGEHGQDRLAWLIGEFGNKRSAGHRTNN